MPGEIQTFIRQKYAKLGKKLPRGRDRVHVDTSVIEENEHAGKACAPLIIESRRKEARAARKVSAILDASGQPFSSE